MPATDLMKVRIEKPFSSSGSSLLIIVFINLVLCLNLNAGKISSPDTIKKQHDVTLLAFYQQGMVMPTNSFVRGNNMKGEPINSFRAVSLQFLKQTNGKELWEQLYNYPRFGIGIYSSQILHTSELGDPIAFYGIFSVPQMRRKNISIYTDIGAGLAFNWKTYFEDKYNIAVGGEATAFAYAGLYLEYYLFNGLFVDAGLSVNHYSNGALKKPNLGINTFSPKISLGYNFCYTTDKYLHNVIPEFEKRNELQISFYTGLENILYNISEVDSITLDNGIYYNTYGLSATIGRQISYKSKVGIGFMFDYLGSACRTLAQPDRKGNNSVFRKGLELSIFPSYEIVVNKFSVLMQSGIYLYRTEYPFRSPVFYQRIGLKYNVMNNISLGIHVRAHRFSIADFIEWTLGYNIKL